MTYEAEVAEYEVKTAEFEAKVDNLVLVERHLVELDHADEALRRRLVADYDVALATSDEAGIADYMVAVRELHEKFVKRHAAIEAVGAEYDALELHRPQRPRRPRRTLSQFLGFK